ncbi:MAG: bifunctional nuclease family protein [Methanoregulaceae archaeon]|nr:bifunctional nuclease family protein [Methanoregulaceae archaeon]MCU0627958.1 bifunctional nuclease family protein [Methanoregulaceae archaeon]
MPSVPCRVKGVFVAKNALGASPAVILSVENDTCLPIYIGLFEAMSIHSALNNEIPPRPLTHDLFVEFLKQFEISLKTLIIDSLEDGVYYANMILERDHHEMTIDCRPSDGIAIGIRCQAGIMIDEEVVLQSAVDASELPELVDISAYLAV